MGQYCSFTVVFCKVSNPWDFGAQSFNYPEIWQAFWQHCCWNNCQISKRHKNLNYQSHTFWDLAITSLIGNQNRHCCQPNSGFLAQKFSNVTWSLHAFPPSAKLPSSAGCWPMHDDIIKWKHFPRYWPFVWAGHRWIPRTKASDVELWCFLWSAP